MSDLNFQKIKINFLDEEFNLIVDSEKNFIDSFDRLKFLVDSLKKNAPFMTNMQILFTISLKVIEEYKILDEEYSKLNKNLLCNDKYNESLGKIEDSLSLIIKMIDEEKI